MSYIEIQNMRQENYLIRLKLDELMNANSCLRVKIDGVISKVKPTSFNFFLDYMGERQTVVKCIKWLILSHNFILDLPQSSQLIHQLINQINPQTSDDTSPMEQLLVDKLIQPYKQYLFKRNLLMLNTQQGQSEIYMLINLLRKALAFTDILFLLGRYFLNQHNFLINFNISIAKDLSGLYRALKTRLNEEQSIENGQILQQINEGLYNVFYNCYFNKFVSHFAPIWIKTDRLVASLHERLQKVRNELKRSMSLNDQRNANCSVIKKRQEFITMAETFLEESLSFQEKGRDLNEMVLF